MGENEFYRNQITEKVEAGWRIENETVDRTTLVKRSIGSPGIHLVLAILTLWWTMGVANLLYAAYKYVADSERTIVWKDSAVRSGEAGTSTAGADRAQG